MFDKQLVKTHLIEYKEQFEGNLLNEAINVRDKIDDIKRIGNINLLENAYYLVLLVIDEKDQELIRFAEQEGQIWSKYSLTLAFKLEWIQAVRRTLWKLLKGFEEFNQSIKSVNDFYQIERNINREIDQFLNHFFMSYSSYKDDLLETHRKEVELLSVPIIPISAQTSVLPLIGGIDELRSQIITEKVLTDISTNKIEVLIIDLSGIPNLDSYSVDHLYKTLDGINMMGCKAIITGMRPNVVQSFVQAGISLNTKAEVRGTLQQALKNYFI